MSVRLFPSAWGELLSGVVVGCYSYVRQERALKQVVVCRSYWLVSLITHAWPVVSRRVPTTWLGGSDIVISGPQARHEDWVLDDFPLRLEQDRTRFYLVVLSFDPNSFPSF
jgi:hypothetical protein